jgi:flagellin
MALTFITNTAGSVAQRNFEKTQQALLQTSKRLSSGKRINSAADDAAGLAMSEKLGAQVGSLSQALRNINDGISVTQMADSSLGQVGTILTRLRELAVQGSNGTISASDRTVIDAEYQTLVQEVDRTLQTTNYNNINLFGGGSIAVKAGISSSNVDTISIATSAVNSTTLSLAGTNLLSSASAQAMVNTIDSAVSSVSSTRGNFGVTQNRLTFAMGFVQQNQEALLDARGKIRDADTAAEAAALSRQQIQQQIAASVLSQAQNLPSLLLTLLPRL